MRKISRAQPAAPGLTSADYQALASFRHGVRRYLAFADAGAKAVGLTPQQHQALLAIKADQTDTGMSIGDLAEQLLIKHHSAVELVGRLLKADLITRAEAPEDRRRVVLSLSARGEQVLAALSANNLRELTLIAPTFADLLTQVDLLTRATAPPTSD